MLKVLLFSLTLITASFAQATDLKVNQAAPLFSAKTHEGKDFSLAARKGAWTVLYFYPKAGTPGCTKQACAFRDNLKKIQDLGAEVYGISADSVEAQAAFHKEHRLNFTLLADPEGKIIEQYGTKVPVLQMSKRWTFVIDPELKIRSIAKDVDPVLDSDRVAKEISQLKNTK